MSTTAIELTQSERNLIFQAVGRRVAAVVTNTAGNKLRTELGDLANKPVLGAFVSLKRNGQLRSCMGCLAERFPLADALENAATRAAKDDPRFPPITPHELLELEMEVWVLWGMRKVSVPAEERPNVIEIGKHGVVLEKGNNRGLLLPGVAVEHKMNQVSFLEACSQKAGLRIDAWKDDNIEFSVFEGMPIPGHIYDVQINDPKTEIAMGRRGPLEMMIQPKNGPTKEEIDRLLDLTKNNFYLCSEGLTPTYFLPDIYDGDVSGVAISLQFPDRPLMICTKMGVKNAIPLQASLIDLVQIIVQQVTRIGATNQERLDAQFDLTVFWDPQIHGTVKNHDLGQLDQFRRSIMVVSNEGWVMQYSPDLPFSGVLEDAIDYLKIADLEMTQIISFETMSTTQQLFASSVSKPILGATQRHPAVAGAFYPSDVTVMNAELDRMLAPGPVSSDDELTTNKPQKAPLHGANVPPGEDASGGISFGIGKKKPGGATSLNAAHKSKHDAGKAKEFFAAAMVPHAGWIYSGRLAAQTLSHVKFPESAIIFAPKHRSGGPD
ncbi:MAG: AmmeMemoRadiSam system protein A, partial [Thermoguttaceae bacterium]